MNRSSDDILTEPPAPKLLPPVSRVPPAWRRELTRILVLSFMGALSGAALGSTLAGICAVLGLFLALYLKHLARLSAWLQRPKGYNLPDSSGIWGEVFDRIIELQRRNRRKKRRLAAMLTEFQASTAALPDGAVVLTEHGEIAWFNQAAQSLLGLRGSADVGVRIANLIRNPIFTEYFVRGEYDHHVEVVSPLNFRVVLSLRIIAYGQEQRLLIVRDVSEMRRMETARRDFVANASHELRTPLTVLRGYIDMMEPELQSSKELAHWRTPIAEMRAQATRMESLVTDMLRLARLEADVPARRDVVDVPAMLRGVVESARALSQNEHKIQATIDKELFLLGDDTDLHSIFTNLVSNAVRYTRTGGEIRVTWTADADGANFCVIDNGIGIAEKDMSRLTERFYRVDIGRSRASGGTGLGLSIVKHALERHDGRLGIQSEVGKGSTFICHFPSVRMRRQHIDEMASVNHQT